MNLALESVCIHCMHYQIEETCPGISSYVQLLANFMHNLPKNYKINECISKKTDMERIKISRITPLTTVPYTTSGLKELKLPT